MPRPLFFYTSLSQRLGMGHYYRLKALADAMPQNPVTWVLDDHSDKNLLKGEPHITLDEALKQNHPLIVDHRNPKSKIYTHPAKIAMIDDFGGHFPVDMIINGNALPDYHHYKGLRAPQHTYAGISYSLLRPGFTQKTSTVKIKDLTIVIGSGPAAKAFLTLLKEEVLPHLKGWSIHLIVGRTLETDVTGMDAHINLPAPELIAKLQESRMALATGGMIVYEALALGLPLIAYPYTPESVPEIAWFEKQQALINLKEAPKAAAILKALQNLYGDTEKQKALAIKGPELIDGQGAKRVADLLRKHIL